MAGYIAIVVALTLLAVETHPANGMPTEDQQRGEMQQEMKVLLEEIADLIGEEKKAMAGERERERFMDEINSKDDNMEGYKKEQRHMIGGWKRLEKVRQQFPCDISCAYPNCDGDCSVCDWCQFPND